MRQTPVGVRCPECVGERTRLRAPGFMQAREPYVTVALILINVGVYLATNSGVGLGGGSFLGGGVTLNRTGEKLTLYGPAVANGETYRLLTSAFIHYGLAHIAFNMYALWLLGGALERYVGHVRFAAIYLVSALAGSFGALLLSPHAQTAGASGAIFGLMGALLVLERQRGIALLGGSIGVLIIINLVISFSIPGISIGGHLGGLAGGALAGLVLSEFGRGHLAYSKFTPVTIAGLLAIAGVAVAGSLAVAGG
jgi:membrane associated rhomboid family serine protease